MSGPEKALNLALEPDFAIGGLAVSPSTVRVTAGNDEHRVEAKTMAVLLTLVRASGVTVTRDDLIAACWEGRIVSDDAIARAIAKVRSLAKLTAPEAFVLETVPKVGYRLVAGEPPLKPSPSLLPETAKNEASPPTPIARPPGWGAWVGRRGSPRVVGIGAAAVLAVAGPLVSSFIIQRTTPSSQAAAPPARVAGASSAYSPAYAADVRDAVINLDERRIRSYLAAGWDPNWTTDAEGNTALHAIFMACERNPTHDREGLVRLAKILIGSGADPALRNGWEDTPLIIARHPKYCGPDHPVVAFLKSVSPPEAAIAKPSQ